MPRLCCSLSPILRISIFSLNSSQQHASYFSKACRVCVSRPRVLLVNLEHPQMHLWHARWVWLIYLSGLCRVAQSKRVSVNYTAKGTRSIREVIKSKGPTARATCEKAHPPLFRRAQSGKLFWATFHPNRVLQSRYARFFHGPAIANVMPSVCRFTNMVEPSGEKTPPANSPLL